MHFLVRRVLPLLIAFTAVSSAYVGTWHTFTNKSSTTSLIAYQGYVYAGTLGGIRRISPSTLEETDYDNLNGLLDCSIVGLAKSADSTGDSTLWAVSQSGYVYSLSGEEWNIYGRSYAAQQWVMSDGAVVAVGHYLWLGSVMGLTLFDLNQKVSQANITQFANLVGDSVLSVLRRQDTLYVGTPQGVYKAGIDTVNPTNPEANYQNLSDPNIWTLVPLSPTLSSGAPRQYNSLAFIGDSLATFGPGMLLQKPLQVEAFSGQPAVIGSTSFDTVTDALSALFFNGDVFLGSSSGLLVSTSPLGDSPSLSTLPTLSQFPDSLLNVATNQDRFWGQSPYGLFQIDPNSGNPLSSLEVPPYSAAAPNTSFLDRHIRNLKVANNGDVYVGSWGGGLLRYRNGQIRAWTQGTDPCIYDVVPNFPVVYAVSNLDQTGLFFTLFEAEGGAYSQLAYLDTASGQVTCLDSNVAGGYAHTVHIFSDSLIGVGSNSGVTFYRMHEGANGATVTSLGLWTTTGQANETWSLSEDDLGRPWALVGNQLAYVETDTLNAVAANPGSAAMTLQVVDGFSGTGCYALENDPLGTLWVGCSNGLYHIYPGASGISKSEFYGLDAGLVGLNISDISVDPSNGQVWIATDHGVSMLESTSEPPVATLQSVRVYPNPFLPQHRFVIFDNLPQDATVRIHNAAGAVVRIFHPSELVGNQAQWDGTNQEGRPVSAGIYLYSVTSGSSVERGKIIVAR